MTLSENNTKRNIENTKLERKICPYCAESIMKSEIKCSFCNSILKEVHVKNGKEENSVNLQNSKTRTAEKESLYIKDELLINNESPSSYSSVSLNNIADVKSGNKLNSPNQVSLSISYGRATRIFALIFGVFLLYSAIPHWFSFISSGAFSTTFHGAFGQLNSAFSGLGSRMLELLIMKTLLALTMFVIAFPEFMLPKSIVSKN